MFQVRPFESKTVLWWHSKRESIDFDPPYQREGNVWSSDLKAYLIDSMLNGFDIPKIYIADFTYVNSPLNTKKKLYAVVDGKQRFQAIFDFIDGKIKLQNNFEYFADPSLNLQGLTYQQLREKHSKIALEFENYSLAVVSVITDEESKINELFIRLNTSKPLSGAELRSAKHGPLPKIIKQIGSHDFFSSKTGFSNKRKEHQNAAAKLLLIEFRGQFVDTKRVDLDRFADDALKSETKLSAFHAATKRCAKTLDRMCQIFRDNDPLLKTSGQLPVYYRFVKANPGAGTELRSFLEHFNNDLVKARSGASSDVELSEYYIFSRTVNDAASMVGRLKILESRYEAWQAKRASHAK